ncbi:MAG: GPR1/FUN34/YaaH family transporter [Thermoplasmataceae archaeon]
MAETENLFGTVFKVDPAPLGLTGFAFTTFMLSFVNAGIIGTAGGTGMAISFAFAYGEPGTAHRRTMGNVAVIPVRLCCFFKLYFITIFMGGQNIINT